MKTIGTNNTTKYNDIKVGDYIIKYNTGLKFYSGVITKIRKWNGNTMTVTLDNGGSLVISKWHSTEYDLYPCPPVTEGN